MSATATSATNSLRNTERNSRDASGSPATAGLWPDTGQELNSPDALQLAFRAFSELSSELSTAYQVLQGRVEQLTREVEQANRQRLVEIAEKERIANRLENLLQLLPGGVVVLNSQGQVSECNSAAQELLGDSLTGQFWRDVIRQRFAPRSDDGHEISLRSGKRVSLATRSLNDESGQIILLTDQTETRRLQQHLSRHQRLSAMGKMVSSLAHQIRTPLSAAMLYAGQLGNTQLSQEQSGKFVGKLVSRLHNMERQVKDMLIFARGDAILDETITMPELFEELKIAAEVLLRSSFSCDWHNSVGDVHLLCNRESLIGALLNLIENAQQAAGQGNEGKGAMLHIRAELVEHTDRDAASKLRLYVQDNGPGISHELLEQITEPFFTTRPQGTGLGLAVAQVVAKAHRGRFFIESHCGAEQTGTRAGFVLPFLAPESLSESRERHTEFHEHDASVQEGGL
ncbi:MAG: ATP-binding protein [Gammaproteobacteria bacterium]|nr:ATP-binding protein [Gammaproteobacteria bacterium]MDP2140836.1 ATP-binding protein [Gammaproteobacteria bacterium]MDP2349421.1 ATP-binding protein [Gammaproteobacteria bacterium]